MIYFEIKGSGGKILAGNMQEFSRKSDFENNKNFSEHKNGKGLKGAFENIDGVDVWVVVEDEQDLLKSTKIFKKTFRIYKTIALDIYKEYKKAIGEYAHILSTIQAQIGQQIVNFADNKEFFGETYADSVKNISDIIEANKESTAKLICYIQKRVIDMRAHLLGAEVIHLGEQYEIKSVTVSLKRAILNQYSPFQEEFEKKEVKIKFFFEDEFEIEVDKTMFSLIMYNFFSNALKYTKFNSEIRLNYSDEEKSLDISMISLKMDKNELSNLHKEGVRGNHAKNIPGGKGIGLFVIYRALELMKKEQMYISPNYENCSTENGHIYIENHFKFSL